MGTAIRVILFPFVAVVGAVVIFGYTAAMLAAVLSTER